MWKMCTYTPMLFHVRLAPAKDGHYIISVVVLVIKCVTNLNRVIVMKFVYRIVHLFLYIIVLQLFLFDSPNVRV